MDEETVVRSDETLDTLHVGDLQIIQKKSGYRFSLDPILLCNFGRIGKGEDVLDLGTGCGVIPLLLARKTAARRIVGIELQPEMADRARRSVLLNGLGHKVEIVPGDVRRITVEEFAPGAFSVVFANPPFRRPQTGRTAPTVERATARHELAGGLEDFIRVASRLLNDGGRFYIVFLADRLAELLALMRRERLEPKRLRCVHGRAGERARMVLVEGRKGGRPELVLEPPLFVYEGEGYSPELRDIYGETAD